MAGRVLKVCQLLVLPVVGFGACGVDERTLHTFAICVDRSAGSASGGLQSQSDADALCETGGSLARGSGGTGAASDGASRAGAGTDAGAAGAESRVGPEVECPDLDSNAVADCTETLLQNATLDRDVHGWRAGTNAVIRWDSADSRADEDSGSLLIENHATTNLTDNGLVYAGATQCVAVESERAYVLFAQMYSASPMVAGYGAVAARTFASDNCSGSPLGTIPSTNQGTISLWVTLQTAVAAPAGAKSLLVELSIGKLASSKEVVSLKFDNVLLR